MITGEITAVGPQVVGAGMPIELTVSLNAFNPGAWGPETWFTKLVARLDGLVGEDQQTFFGEKGTRDRELLKLGTMPGRSLSGSITLYGRKITEFQWRQLDTHPLNIMLPRDAPGATPLPDPYVAPPTEPKKPWEFWKPDEPETYDPGYPFPEPIPEEVKPADKTTWLWVGLAVVGVVVLGFTLRRGM